nr:hypothetical protein [Tanacetum cinerariifolium]
MGRLNGPLVVRTKMDSAMKENYQLNDGHGIGNFDNDLVRDNAPYHANEEEKQSEEDRCEMLRNPCQELLF